MAAIDSYTKKPPQQKQQISDPKKDNPTKFYYNFLYKALTISLFLIILPLFPSQAPEFVNQTLFTRSWELLHLLFVGIAISYGLFSRKNDNNNDDKNDTNNNNKFDNAQNYVSRFLQISSVFEEDSENPSASDENKVQTWSSQYMRNEPVVVVAQYSKKKCPQKVSKSRCFLPVRSLKETSSVSAPVSRSNSRRFSSNSKTRNGEFGAFDDKELMEEKVKKESFVLPSPIPWRSRTGRMEMKEEQEAQESSEESHARFFLVDDPEFSRFESRVQMSQSSRFSRPNSANSSPKISPSPSAKKPSPSPSSFSPVSQSKIAEDMVKKRSFYNKTNPPPAPPPPPPPPPPTFYRSSRTNKGFESVSSDKEAKKKVGFRQTFSKDEEEEEEDLEEKVFEEFDQEDTESEDDEIGQSFSRNFDKEITLRRNEESGSCSVGDEGPDVDKKADEFIAKFREQIRLQRIESIKRSTVQISRKLTR